MAYEIESTYPIQPQSVGAMVWDKYLAELEGQSEYRPEMEGWEVSTMHNVAPGQHPAVQYAIWEGEKSDGRAYLEFGVAIPGLTNPAEDDPLAQLYTQFEVIPGDHTNLSKFEPAIERVRKALSGE